MVDKLPPIQFIPCSPQSGHPYPEINDYSYRRLAPEIQAYYRPAGPMAPGSWLFTGASPEERRDVFRP